MLENQGGQLESDLGNQIMLMMLSAHHFPTDTVRNSYFKFKFRNCSSLAKTTLLYVAKLPHSLTCHSGKITGC